MKIKRPWNLHAQILGSLFLFVASVLQAQTETREYRYFPDSKFGLGIGFSPNDLSDVKLPCIDFKERPLSAGAVRTKLTASYVANAQDVSNASNLDIRASAEFLGGSASEHFNLNTSENFSEMSINVVVNAVTDYGQWGMAPSPEPRLTERAQSLLKSNPPEFARTCGTRYISMERRASAAGVLISISSVKHSWKEAFMQEASGGYGAGGMSASASVKFSSELKTALEEHRVSFQVFSTGGDGFGSLGEMCKGLTGKEDNPMDVIASGLDSFLKTFGKSNAAIYSFSASPMEYFGWDASRDLPWTDTKSQELLSIVDEYRRIGETIENAEQFTDPDSAWHRAICDESPCYPASVALETSLIQDAKEFQSSLKDAYNTCTTKQDMASCPVPSIPPKLIIFVRDFSTPPPPVVQFRVSARINLAPGEHFNSSNWPQTVSGVRARAVLNSPEDLRLKVLQSFVPADGFQVLEILHGRFLETGKLVFVEPDKDRETALTTETGETNGSSVWYSMPPQPAFDYLPTLLATLASFTKQDQVYKGSGTVFLDLTDKIGRSFRLALFDLDFDSSDGNLTSISENYDYLTEKVPSYF